MSGIKSFLYAFTLLGINFMGCAQDKLPEMSASELKQEIKNDTSLVILDVRTPAELKGPLGQIDGIINIPVQELESRINELNQYKDKHIAVICRTGHRSSIAQEMLEKHGIKSTNVKGGMTAYRQDGGE